MARPLAQRAASEALSTALLVEQTPAALKLLAAFNRAIAGHTVSERV